MPMGKEPGEGLLGAFDWDDVGTDDEDGAGTGVYDGPAFNGGGGDVELEATGATAGADGVDGGPASPYMVLVTTVYSVT